MKRFLGFISYTSFILSIIFTIFLFAFIYLSIYSNNNYDYLYKKELNPDDGKYYYTLQSVGFFGVVHFTFIATSLSFGMLLVFYINKIFMATRIYDLTGIYSWITFCSIIPLIGIIIDWFIFYKSIDSFEERKISDIILNHHFVKSIHITQTIFSLFIFLVINSLTFIIYSEQLFGEIWLSYLPICLIIQYIGSVCLFISLAVGIIYFIIDLVNINELSKTLNINKKQCLNYVFFPWLITNSKYENTFFLKVNKDF